ncbi:MAG: hypothetical protein KDH91_22580, partial [Rhodoferax sp.]|nr:hypothetical protein [Rhodoferax sp.]
MSIQANRSEWTPESEGHALLDITLGTLIDRQAEALADQDAVVYRYPEIDLDLRLGFRQLRDRVNAVAKGL